MRTHMGPDSGSVMSRTLAIEVIDSHTGGEPTRIVIAGGPGLGDGTLAEQRRRFAAEFDWFRSAVVNEPRGSDVLVGGLLVPPSDASCVAGVIFFNNVGVLNMCGHGTMGLAVTLAEMGRISAGSHRLDTPVGVVTFHFDGQHKVTLDNVPSYRTAKGVQVELADGRRVVGDIAWGGNWFFLVNEHDQALEPHRVEELTRFTWDIRQALERQGLAGSDGGVIDHIELFGPPKDPANHGRNFVLCPGKAYDRSPCGTGTSAKLACLFADGKLRPGELWRQESIIGSVFEGSVTVQGGQVIPRITGTAYVTARATLFLDPDDPFRMGIRP